jgi:dihydrofolate reductase
MSKLRFQLAMSLDGYVAGPDQSEENPLGVGGLDLHQWVFDLEAWRKQQGMQGGDVNASTPVIEEAQSNVGATVMGRNMFGGGPGPWSENPPWNGWWGDDPPFHTPVFVLTHHPREPLAMEGGITFTFVTDGIESALEQAREDAGDQDVLLGGGADVAQQYLAAGWSTNSSSTSCRSCSVTASGCSRTSAISNWSSCARSRRPASPTSSTASSDRAADSPAWPESSSFEERSRPPWDQRETRGRNRTGTRSTPTRAS